MMMGNSFRRGDWVEVRSLPEILDTLDENGTLDGLPFMPEMAVHCGRRFRLARLALKACVECFVDDRKIIDMREFRERDVWVLDQQRCSGADHDGCQRGCLVFWKAAWLQRVSAVAPVAQPTTMVGAAARPTLKTKATPDRYFCQSTELVNVTQPLTLMRRLQLCVEDVRVGNERATRMIAAILRPLFWKTVHRFIPRHVVGRLSRTPMTQLALRPGEVVEVKNSHDIAQTLNSQGCNRGLRYDRGLNRFCGNQFRVRDRLDRMIVESTGQMIHMQGTVTLEGTTCLCHMSALGGCPRKDPVYWREIWLERVKVPPV